MFIFMPNAAYLLPSGSAALPPLTHLVEGSLYCKICSNFKKNFD